MPTLDDILAKELRQTIGKLPTIPSIYELPNPLEGKGEIQEGRVYRVKGIEDSVFSPLNDELVVDMGRVKPERTVRGKAGRAKRDERNQIIKEKPSTPAGSKFIRTKHKLDIPFRFESTGFNYADFIGDLEDGYKYIYAIPKDNLYTVHMTALAVSSRTMRCYSGHKFKTWHFGSLTVAVIPYNPKSKYTNTIILLTKAGIDYGEEIKEYVNGLIAQGVIPNVADFSVEGGYRNLVYEEARISYDGYEEESTIPLSEEKSMSYATLAAMTDGEPEVGWDEGDEGNY